MKINARDAQARFGEIMSTINREPITITKHGKETAVVISYEDYNKFQNLEELYWGLKAQEAEEEGYLSPDESETILGTILQSK